jgi:hypothetical protein
VSIDPSLLIQQPAVDAGVSALAARNQHHLAGMTEEERRQALEHWHQLAIDVLGAARGALESPPGPDTPMAEGTGRAIIVFEDAADDGVVVNVRLEPEPEDLGNGEFAATPAQVMAIDWLESMQDAGEEQ